MQRLVHLLGRTWVPLYERSTPIGTRQSESRVAQSASQLTAQKVFGCLFVSEGGLKGCLEFLQRSLRNRLAHSRGQQLCVRANFGDGVGFLFETLRISSPASVPLDDRRSAPNLTSRRTSLVCSRTRRFASHAPTEGLRSFFNEEASSESPSMWASETFASRAAVNSFGTNR